MRISILQIKKPSLREFPGGPVVENPPSNAGDVGSILGGGAKTPHAARQLSPYHGYRAHTT